MLYKQYTMKCEKCQCLCGEAADASSEYRAFRNCTSLKKIRFPYYVRNIDTCAFDGCTALEQVVFNRLDTNIESDSFPANCSATFYTPKNGNLFATHIYSQLAAQEYNITVYKLGDVCNTSGSGTGDFKVTQADANRVFLAYSDYLSGYSLGLNTKQQIAGDVNGDDAVTIEDAQWILSYINSASAGYPFGMEAWMSGKLNGNF